MNHPLLPLPERSEETDKYYAVLGRALAYITEFEFNCRKLAHLFDVETADSDFGYEIVLLMEKGSLFDKIKKLVTDCSLPDWTSEKIHKAREARNRIAHEIARYHIEMMTTEVSRRSFETDILLEVQDVAKGNQIVLDIIRILNNSSAERHGSDVVEYQLKISEWILA